MHPLYASSLTQRVGPHTVRGRMHKIIIGLVDELSGYLI